MKFQLTLGAILLSTVVFCQHYFPIIEKSGKYGYASDNHSKGVLKFQIPPNYDTLYYSGGYSPDIFVTAIKGKSVDLFHVIDNYDRIGVSKFDTLGINHIYQDYSEGEYTPTTLGTTADGKVYVYQYGNVIEPLTKGKKIPVTIRKEEDKYWLYANNRKLTEQGYDFINTEPDMFVCMKANELFFFNMSGNKLYDHGVTSFFQPSELYEYVFVSKGNKKGYFKIDGSESSALIPYHNSNRVWQPDQYYGGNWEWHINKYYSVGTDNNYGLQNSSGKEIWPTKYESIVVGYIGKSHYVLRKTKNKKWELYDPDLNLITVSDFDEFIGYDLETAVVRYGNRLVTYDPGTGDTSLVNYTQAGDKYRVLISPNNSVGVINGLGNLIIPCSYKDLRDYHEEIFEVKTDSGYIAINMEGEIVSPYAFDRCWEFTQSEGAYAFNVGQLWGTFDLKSGATLPPTRLFEPYAQFNIDVEAHTSIPEFYVVIKGGKMGISDKFGHTVHDTDFDVIYKSDVFDVENLFLGIKGDQFYVFKADMTELKEVKAQYFLEFSPKIGYVFATENELLCIDPITLEPVDYHSTKYHGIQKFMAYDKIHGDNIEGVVDGEGKIIIPFKFQQITAKTVNNDPYIIVKRDLKDNFYTISGRNILETGHDKISAFCIKWPAILFIKKEFSKGGYIAQWNAKTESLETLTENVKSVKCVSWKKLEYIAEIEFMDGSKGILYEDLRIEVEK